MGQSEVVRAAYEAELGPLVGVELARLRAALPDNAAVEQRFDELLDEGRQTASIENAPAFDDPADDVPAEATSLEGQFSLMQSNADFLEKGLELAWPDNSLFTSGGGVYVAAHPSKELNARVEPLAGGYLVSVNVGAMMMCHLVSKILFAATRFTRYDANGNLEEDPAAGLPAYTLEELNHAIVDVFASYIIDGDATLSARLKVQGGVRGRLAVMMRSAMEFFIVAHEFAHALSGHLSREMTRNDELVADAVAWEAVDRTFAHTSDPGSKIIGIAGIVAFFTTEQLLRDLRSPDSPGVSGHDSSHPSPEERVHSLVTANHWSESDLGGATPMVQWLLDRYQMIEHEVRRRQALSKSGT